MPGGARPIGTIRTLPHQPRGCWGASGWRDTPIWRRMRVCGLSFHKALLHHCGHLRGIRGGGSNSHTSQQRLPFNTVARGAHRVGSWGLALGLGAADQELAIGHSSPGLATRLHWREGDSSQPAYLFLSLAKPCDVGFLPVFKGTWGKILGCWRETAGPMRTISWHFSQGWLSRSPVLRSWRSRYSWRSFNQFLEQFVLVSISIFFVAVVSLQAMRGRSYFSPTLWVFNATEVCRC